MHSNLSETSTLYAKQLNLVNLSEAAQQKLVEQAAAARQKAEAKAKEADNLKQLVWEDVVTSSFVWECSGNLAMTLTFPKDLSSPCYHRSCKWPRLWGRQVHKDDLQVWHDTWYCVFDVPFMEEIFDFRVWSGRTLSFRKWKKQIAFCTLNVDRIPKVGAWNCEANEVCKWLSWASVHSLHMLAFN